MSCHLAVGTFWMKSRILWKSFFNSRSCFHLKYKHLTKQTKPSRQPKFNVLYFIRGFRKKSWTSILVILLYTKPNECLRFSFLQTLDVLPKNYVTKIINSLWSSQWQKKYYVFGEDFMNLNFSFFANQLYLVLNEGFSVQMWR